jgi:hypothetical protein
MSSELKELKDEMGTPFAVKSGWLINRIRALNAINRMRRNGGRTSSSISSRYCGSLRTI